MARWWTAIVLYGLLNAASYSCLLPLWEGFDEGFHYGYVQYLSTQLRFPVLGQATLSREIWHAYELAPVSHYLQSYTKAPVSFTDYFAFPAEARRERRRLLDTLPAAEKFQSQPDKPNYEVNQSPLPYLLMAPVDRALSGFSLPIRVLWLRLLCSSAAIVLLAHSTRLLCREVALPEWSAAALLFCVFSSQMLYAVLCHVCNDSFAVAAMGYLILSSIRAWRGDSSRHWLLAGLALAAALLSKAYYLFLVPLPCALLLLALWKRRAGIRAALWFCMPPLLLAGPWYARNLVLYRNLSGTVESTSNLGIGLFLQRAAALPWRESIAYMAHASLWTGNNSFTTFSAATLNILLALLCVGVIFCFSRAQRDIAEWTVTAAVILFGAGLGFITVAFYISSQGAAIAAVPWYMQVLLMPVLLLAFLGCARVQPWGRFLGGGYVLLWTYLLLATWFVKLIPLYGGFSRKPRLGDLWRWYWQGGGTCDELLRTICLAPPAVVWGLIGGASLLGIFLCGRLMARASV